MELNQRNRCGWVRQVSFYVSKSRSMFICFVICRQCVAWLSGKQQSDKHSSYSICTLCYRSSARLGSLEPTCISGCPSSRFCPLLACWKVNSILSVLLGLCKGASFQQLQKILICVTAQQGGADMPQARFKRPKDSAIPASAASVPLFLKTLRSWDF